MARAGTAALAVEHDHALWIAALPPHHRDPIDRLMVAQCQAERLRLVTADRQFEPYEVDIIRAV